MTKIEVIRKSGSVVKYQATGHSEYGEYGSDIVCAALWTGTSNASCRFSRCIRYLSKI